MRSHKVHRATLDSFVILVVLCARVSRALIIFFDQSRRVQKYERMIADGRHLVHGTEMLDIALPDTVGFGALEIEAE